MSLRRLLHRGSDAPVYRITGARQSLEDDVRGRERRYIISMLVRTASVILTVVLWNVSRPLAIATLFLGAVIPYVAVVVANAGREKSPALPSTFLTDADRRPALPVRPPQRPSGGSAHPEGSRPEDPPPEHPPGGRPRPEQRGPGTGDTEQPES
ncbi:DUF3099 domain-containing protein [Streptomyces sp. ACA25]|uniref:DUF3099 domain-containing protein n=1 Tax=Streptomyces sp. ACA25 TaxID=3022596 RepID=UPI0023075B82|nr:DUF3099 domain-containing protein [Streptomyces sp. ACA25]MDB1088421.1 DUF3099 domain-containing protein [Streptomyces sp. ACA25]